MEFKIREKGKQDRENKAKDLWFSELDIQIEK